MIYMVLAKFYPMKNCHYAVDVHVYILCTVELLYNRPNLGVHNKEVSLFQRLIYNVVGVSVI